MATKKKQSTSAKENCRREGEADEEARAEGKNS
jgi:hypothetical protein